MSRVLLDTPILIAEGDPGEVDAAISVVSLAELHFGLLVVDHDREERARRAQRLGAIESAFEPIQLDAAIAREWGRLAAATVQRGGKPRRRAMDLAIAATASVEGVPLMTADTADFGIIDDLVEVIPPPA